MTTRSYSSRSVRFGARLLAASASVTVPFVLQGCSDGTQGSSAIYKDVEACVADKVFTPDYCRDNFEKAKEEHTRLAPRYEDQKDCEKDWGDKSCQIAPDRSQTQPSHGSGGDVVRTYYYGGSGGSSYSPRMNGYWVGNVADPPANGAAAAQRSFTYPVYRSSEGVYSPATNQNLGDVSGRISTRPNVAVAAETMTAPRAAFPRGTSFTARPTSVGGFGATARGFGFGVGA